MPVTSESNIGAIEHELRSTRRTSLRQELLKQLWRLQKAEDISAD